VCVQSYKSYKALESRSLSAAQGMLLYWCMTAFVNAAKEIVDQILGTYSNIFIWKFTVLTLKAAPLIIGPERMYSYIIKPLFDAHEEQVDAVVDKAHAIKSLAQEAVPAVKEGDVEGVQAKAGEMAAELKETGTEIIDTLTEKANEVAAVLEEKAETIGIAWDRKGAMGLLEQAMSGVEQLRDWVVDFSLAQWEQHGPFITEKTKVARTKGVALYNQHAPVVKQKAMTKIQPAINAVNEKINTKIRPVLHEQSDKAQALWLKHGGPVRKFYNGTLLPLWVNTLRPFWGEQAKPFLLHSFLPALYETLVALKDRAVDLLSPPSEEVKTRRAEGKRRRREAVEARATWKRRGDKAARKWSHSWKELDADATMGGNDAAGSSGAHQQQPAATLTNRATKETRDSSLEQSGSPSKPIDAAHSTLDAAAPAFEPSAPVQEQEQPAGGVWAVSKPAGIAHEAGLPLKSSSTDSTIHDKLASGEKFHLGVKDNNNDAAYASEPRSGNIAEPIQ
jgi:hypothetical protein